MVAEIQLLCYFLVAMYLSKQMNISIVRKNPGAPECRQFDFTYSNCCPEMRTVESDLARRIKVPPYEIIRKYFHRTGGVTLTCKHSDSLSDYHVNSFLYSVGIA